MTYVRLTKAGPIRLDSRRVMPEDPKCHASPSCPNDATGYVKRRGRGQGWVPTCDTHVGPWTFGGAAYRRAS